MVTWHSVLCSFIFFAGLLRYRYDQLMELDWKILLPCSFSFFIFNYTLLLLMNSFPF